YLTLESGSSIDSADQFVLYYIVGGSQERYPKLVVNGQTQANNQLIEGAPYSGANNVYYFTLNGKVPSDMANLAVIEKIAFRPAAAAPGTDWSMLDSDNIPFVYESSDE
ncbi:MAG: hypothetical protein KDC44_08480, partial [Phaeodactylibacter sp.]|nr:hypothetical protein [Phaeodactylibacter sp.]